MRDEDGQVSAFVVGMVLALFVLAALVIDGGRVLAARREAIDEANEAARAGAEALSVSTYRATGIVALDTAAATSAARAYLERTGHAGTVAVAGDRVTVTVSFSEALSLFGIMGLSHMTVNGHGAATLVRGVGSPGP
jgi:Flp pilus assembly protein TadG